MPRNFRAMIVEDNRQLAEAIRGFFVIKKGMEVAEPASNSLDAIEMLKAYRPDVIILDLVMPRSDGFALLEHLNTLPGEGRPDVLVLSALRNDAIIRRACDLGAVYYMIKPFSMEDLYDRVVGIAQVRGTSRLISARPSYGSKSVDSYLSGLLLDFGISSQHKGYRYLCEAVKLVVEQPALINSITKELYPEIGRKFHCSPLAVERSVRHAIGTSCDGERYRRDARDLYGAGALRDRPTNGRFISLISSKVRDYISQ